jgi:hypothetical protein
MRIHSKHILHIMRIKTLLCAAGVAAMAIPAMADNVYSVNVVGYVNRPLQGSSLYTLVANPFDTGNNVVSNLFASLPTGWSVTKWTGAGFAAPVSKTGFSPYWSPAAGGYTNTVNPGEAVFVKAAGGAQPYTNVFVGTVLQNGSFTNSLHTGYNLIGNMVPDSGAATNAALSFAPPTGAILLQWKEDGTSGYLPPFTKTGFAPGWSPSVPNLNVGVGFFMNMSAQTYKWIRNFTVK